MSERKLTGTVKETFSKGKDDPTENFYMITDFVDELAGHEGTLAETGVMTGISLPLPGIQGKMGPWAKVDVTVTRPCVNSDEAIQAANVWCQNFAQKRTSDIVKEIINKG